MNVEKNNAWAVNANGMKQSLEFIRDVIARATLDVDRFPCFRQVPGGVSCVTGNAMDYCPTCTAIRALVDVEVDIITTVRVQDMREAGH